MHPLQAPEGWSELPSTQRVRFHIRSVAVQLQQVSSFLQTLAFNLGLYPKDVYVGV